MYPDRKFEVILGTYKGHINLMSPTAHEIHSLLYMALYLSSYCNFFKTIDSEEQWKISGLKEEAHMLGYSDLFEQTKYRDKYDLGTTNQNVSIKNIHMWP